MIKGNGSFVNGDCVSNIQLSRKHEGMMYVMMMEIYSITKSKDKGLGNRNMGDRRTS